jgi:GNAT superfamily N-acetyltransferase
MSRRLVSVTLDNLSDLPPTCRNCVYWELDPVAGQRACDTGDTALEKEAWLSDTLLEWGSCGLLAYVDGVPAGYALYAPAAYVPRSVAFPTSPVSADAALLMTARLMPEFLGQGLGRMLVQGVAREIVRRGIRAVEAFGRMADDGPEPPRSAEPHCLLPAEYLLAVGFKTVRPHPRTPRLRLDVKTTVTWKEDVEYALDRLLASMQTPVLSR